MQTRSRTNEMREGTFRSGETMPNHFVARNFYVFRAKAEGRRWRRRHINVSIELHVFTWIVMRPFDAVVSSVPTSSSIIPIQVQQKELEFQVIVTHPRPDARTATARRHHTAEQTVGCRRNVLIPTYGRHSDTKCKEFY